MREGVREGGSTRGSEYDIVSEGVREGGSACGMEGDI